MRSGSFQIKVVLKRKEKKEKKKKKKSGKRRTHGNWGIDRLHVALLNQNFAGAVAQVLHLLLADQLTPVELLNLPGERGGVSQVARPQK